MDVFKIIKTEPVIGLLEIFDLKQDDDYELKISKGGLEYISIPIRDDNNSKALYAIMNELDIFIAGTQYYLSDFILLRKTPNDAAIQLINMFTVDQLFSPYLTTDKLFKYIKKM